MKKQKIFLKNKQLLGFYLVVGVLFSVISVVAPSISGELVNAVIYRQGDVKVYWFLLVLTYILLLLFSIADQYFFQYFQIKEKNAMRNELFQASLKRGNQEKEQIAAFTSFVNNDVPNIVENYYGGTVDIIKCVCIIICVALELFQIHWLLAVIIFGSSILIIMIPNIMRGYASKNRKNYGEALEKFNAVQQSLLSGAETVKVCLYRSNAKRMIENKNNEIEKEEKRLRNCQVSVYGLAGGMQILKRFLILAVGVYLIYRNIIKVGGLLVAVQLAEVLAAPAETLAYLLNAKNEARPLVEKYEQLAETEEDRGKTDINDIEDICVEHLSYGRNGVKIIKDVSFTFEKGRKYMLTGSSGSGKSTLVNLIPRFYDVTEGSITIDGEDIRNITQHELRDRLGYVPQKGVLFSGTIESNILYGNPDGSETEMKEAAAIAQASDFIEEKNKKYESRIAQGGANVSGGQKQRLSIARAIAKQPDVFIFDDSFSALDYKTDVALRKALKEHTTDSVVLIVAQRISTILHAEQIIVLDEGKVVGRGTHEELLKTCEVYQQIAMSQLSEEELAGKLGKEEKSHE